MATLNLLFQKTDFAFDSNNIQLLMPDIMINLISLNLIPSRFIHNFSSYEVPCIGA